MITEEQRTEMHLDALATSIYLREFSLCRSLFVFPAADAQVIGKMRSKLLIFWDFFSPALAGTPVQMNEQIDLFLRQDRTAVTIK